MWQENVSLEERLAAHSRLKERVRELLGFAESDIESGDEAEKGTIERVRGLGNEVHKEWARHQEQTQTQALNAEASTRQLGEKNSAGRARSGRSRAPIAT